MMQFLFWVYCDRRCFYCKVLLLTRAFELVIDTIMGFQNKSSGINFAIIGCALTQSTERMDMKLFTR